MANQYQLRIFSGSLTGLVFPINKAEFKIGRDESCDLVLNENSISRIHLFIYSHENGIVLVDNNSTNGTTVNNFPITAPVQLSENDVICMGGEVTMAFQAYLPQPAAAAVQGMGLNLNSIPAGTAPESYNFENFQGNIMNNESNNVSADGGMNGFAGNGGQFQQPMGYPYGMNPAQMQNPNMMPGQMPMDGSMQNPFMGQMSGGMAEPYSQVPPMMGGQPMGMQNPMGAMPNGQPQMPFFDPRFQQPAAPSMDPNMGGMQQPAPFSAPVSFEAQPVADNSFNPNPMEPQPFAAEPASQPQAQPFAADPFSQQMPAQQPFAGEPAAQPNSFGTDAFSQPQAQPFGMDPAAQMNSFNNDPYAQPQMGAQQPFGADPVSQQNAFGMDPYAQQQMPGQQNPYGMDPYAQQQMAGQQNAFGMDPYAQQQMAAQQNPYGMDPYAQQQMGAQQNPYGNNPYGQQQMPGQQNPYGMDPYAQQQMMGQQNPYGNNPYAQQQNPYGMDPYAQQMMGQQIPYGNNPYAQQQMPGQPQAADEAAKKRKLFIILGAILLVIILLVVFIIYVDSNRLWCDVFPFLWDADTCAVYKGQGF